MTDFYQTVINTARSCVGTPFLHQGRNKKTGLDCIGLVVVSLEAAGLKVHDRQDYSRRPDGKSIVNALEQHNAVKIADAPVSCDQIQRGDLLLFSYDNQIQHIAIATSSSTIIHSYATAKKVVETDIGSYWLRRLACVYRFSSVQNSGNWQLETGN